MRASRELGAVVIVALAGCYQVSPPGEYACSAAEPECPAGLLCHQGRCVSEARPDALHVDAPRTDARRSDLPRTDGQHPCAAWSAWTDCAPTPLESNYNCGNRTVRCILDPITGWNCSCQIGAAQATLCGTKPLLGFPTGCAAAAALFLEVGCCKP